MENTTRTIWNNFKPKLEQSKAYKHKNSTGQKSGCFFIDNQLIIEIFFFDDTSVVYQKMFDEYEKSYFNDTINDELADYIYGYITPYVNDKEKQFEVFEQYQELNKKLGFNSQLTKGAKV